MTPDSAPDALPLPLPGLEVLNEREAAIAGDLALAVRRSIGALERLGLVREVDAARLQLALELADVVTIKKRTQRMSTIGNDARVLVDLLDKLLPAESDVDESIKAAMAEWAEVEAQRQQHDATAVPPAPADPT